jgi:phosphinothricin acetyltransferase
MPPEGHLRFATMQDLPAIVAIYNSTISGRMVTADLTPIAVESRIPWFEAHQPDRYPLWVWESHGNVAAWMSFQAFYGRPAYRATAEISLYVHEAFRRTGLGRHLLAEGCIKAQSLRIKTLLGFIFAHNEPSLRLFEAGGFERWGHFPRVAELDGIERDLVIVGRRLTE